MRQRNSRNSTTTHPNPSLLNQGYTFFPPGSNPQMSNMRGVTLGSNTSVISGSWGSYVRMDIRYTGSTANMDGSDRVNHDRQDGRDDSLNGEMDTPECQDGMLDSPAVVTDDNFPPELSTRGRRQSFISEALISPAARLNIHENTNVASIYRPRMRDQPNNPTSFNSSHTRTNTNVRTSPMHSNFFRGASNVVITGGATFNTIVDGVVVESHTYGPGPINNFEFGVRSATGQSPTSRQDQGQRSRFDISSQRQTNDSASPEYHIQHPHAVNRTVYVDDVSGDGVGTRVSQLQAYHANGGASFRSSSTDTEEQMDINN